MRWLIVFGAALSVACGSDALSAPTGPVNAQVVLAAGETANVAAANVRIRFEGVTGDSRCPGDAICIQGGDAIVHVAIGPIGSEAMATFELHTGSLQPATFNGLTIALENLSPYPFSSRPPIAPGDYRATLRLTR
jgi:hypothetical protein